MLSFCLRKINKATRLRGGSTGKSRRFCAGERVAASRRSVERRHNFHKLKENFPNSWHNEKRRRQLPAQHLTVFAYGPALSALVIIIIIIYYFPISISKIIFQPRRTALYVSSFGCNPLRANNLKSIKFMTLQTWHQLITYVCVCVCAYLLGICNRIRAQATHRYTH